MSCIWPFGDTPSSQGISGRGDGDNRETMSKSKLQKTAHVIVVESLDVPPEQTYNLPAALILPKESCE